MAAEMTVGSIIHLKNSAPDGGYLDTYGWVVDKPAFWNVAGTERIFVSTHGASDRGGGTTSWQLVSADGKAEGAPLAIGDRIHLLNMYPQAGYLDCCGWIQHLPPFSEYVGKVTCGVFTSGARDREDGTGVWTIRSAEQKKNGDPLLENDAIYLDNGHPDTGSLVTYGKVTDHTMFEDYQGQQLFVFTSAYENRAGEHGIWTVSLSYFNNSSNKPLFDFFHPDLLKGRVHNMKGVSNMTSILLHDAFQSIGGISIKEVSQVIDAEDKQQQLEELLKQAKLRRSQILPDIIDSDFHIKQLLNLFVLSQVLNSFNRDTLQQLMSISLTNHQHDQTLSPLHLFRRCFQHIAADHEIIQRATVQRRWDQEDDKHDQVEQAVGLLVMDKLALKAVTPFQHLLPGVADQLAIITYFSETTHIHRMPYTNRFILVGVSYDRISPAGSISDDDTLTGRNFSAFELMAIPHEVGHYIYQRGKLENGRSFPELSKKFESNPYYRWCEEIFADLYGCIVAGPLSVFSMQVFLTSGDEERAWRDDQEHPTPLLRSYILSEILRVLSDIDTKIPKRYPFSKVTSKLDEDWSGILEQWGYERLEKGKGRPARIYLPDDSAMHLERIVNVDRVMKAIRPIIKEFAERLLETAKFDQSNTGSEDQFSTNIPWSQGDYETSTEYAREMATLTGWETAIQPVSLEVLLDIKTDEVEPVSDTSDADELLKWFLDKWGDKGPLGFGGH